MAKLTKAERAVINQLLDHSVFTGTIEDKMRASEVAAREACQKPEGQRRINGWFKQTFGRIPWTFRDNWLWLSEAETLTPIEMTVMLATLKAVINTPAAQGVEADRVIECRPVVLSVQTATPDLTEKEVTKIITALFVNRFALLVPDNPEAVADQSSHLVDEFWDVAPDFVAVAQLIVQALQMETEAPATPALQQVNAYLLKHRFMDANAGELWLTLRHQKEQVAASWQPLQRFYLEVGDDYALLLDANRQQLKARAYFVALAVAHSLTSGLPEDELKTRIDQLSRQLYPDATVVSAQVKVELQRNALAWLENGTWLATPIAGRFAITLEDDDYDK